MPINRPDGRHWCDPASETADDKGSWTCPECQQTWIFKGNMWAREEDVEVVHAEFEDPNVAEPAPLNLEEDDDGR